MKKILAPVSNQDGSMIFIALILLVMLTVMGVTASTSSVVENRIAVNQQLHKMAFNHADSGIFATAKVISAIIDEEDAFSDEGYAFEYNKDVYGTDLELFYDQITGLAEYDEGIWDIQYVLENDSCIGNSCIVRVDIEILRDATGGVGGGAVFGEGATTPVGALEISIFFRIFSEGTAPRNSISALLAGYQKVIGVGGGI